jgi:hypothetical protein
MPTIQSYVSIQLIEESAQIKGGNLTRSNRNRRARVLPMIQPFKQLQSALIEYFAQEKLTHFITLSFNRDILDLYRTDEIIRRFHAGLDRKLLGCRWDKVPSEARTLLFAFPERGGLRNSQKASKLIFEQGFTPGLHYHLLVGLAKNPRYKPSLAELSELVRKLWQQLTPQGSVNVQEIYAAKETARYSTKQLPDNEFVREHWLILPPARPRRIPEQLSSRKDPVYRTVHKPQPALPIRLAVEETVKLQKLITSDSSRQLVQHVRIIFVAAPGNTNSENAASRGVLRPTGIAWRRILLASNLDRVAALPLSAQLVVFTGALWHL